MGFLGLLVLAVGLAMDATAVSAARGLLVRRVRPGHVARVAVYFGGFQALMPLVGYLAGERLGPLVRSFQGVVAFVLLTGIGAKMLWEARGAGDAGETGVASDVTAGADPFAHGPMLVLAVATSIDAFAAGVTLPLLAAPMALSLATIGVTTAVLSACGLFLGRALGASIGKRLDAVGGLVLVALGVRALATAYSG